MIKIPDFKKMSDEKLHGWEFRVYESLPAEDGRELVEIIGKKKTIEYYNERGLRNDLKAIDEMEDEIKALAVKLKKARERIINNKSACFYFGKVV